MKFLLSKPHSYVSQTKIDWELVLITDALHRYENEASAEVGYKLAFNFLKADQFVEAIDVCHKVLKVFPDCPRIQEEILHKAIGGLRP